MKKKIWKILGSVKLTIALFVLIIIPSIIGTVIQQNAPDPNQYVETYGSAWSGIFRYLGFFDVYHDSRFVILLVLLGLNTLVCTFSRARPKWRLAGMLMTHLGLLLIMLGALSGAIWGVKGFMAIGEGETTNQMSVGRSNQDVAELPFDIKLVDFILDMHEEPTNRLIVADSETRQQQSYGIKEGQTIFLSEPRWAGMAALVGMRPDPSAAITVKKIIPNAVEIASLTEGPDETGIAAMEFQLSNGEIEGEGFIYSDLEHPNFLEEANLGIGYKKISGADSIEDQIQMANSLFEVGDHLKITANGRLENQVHPAKVGSRFQVEGTDYLVEVLQYVPDFVIDVETREVASRSEMPNNPAILVRISGPSDSNERWLFSKAPEIHETGEDPFKIKFSSNTIKDYLLVLDDSTKGPVLAHFSGGKLIAREGIVCAWPPCNRNCIRKRWPVTFAFSMGRDTGKSPRLQDDICARGEDKRLL